MRAASSTRISSSRAVSCSTSPQTGPSRRHPPRVPTCRLTCTDEIFGNHKVITRHGEDVAVVVDIGEYRRLTRPAVDLASVLLGGPKLDDGIADVFAEIEAERKADFGRAVDLEAGR
jgi:hypothetical protein